MKKNIKFYFILFGIIYFIQGIQSLPGQSVSYWLKDTLKLSEFTINKLMAIISIGWLIKPIYGWIIDNFTLFKSKQKNYLVLTISLSLICFLLLIILKLTLITYIILMFISSFIFAFNDVIIDAIMVVTGKKHNCLGKFQNIQWRLLEIASVLSSFFGGIIAIYFNIKVGFIIIFIFLLLTLFFILFKFKEKIVKKSKKLVNPIKTIITFLKKPKILFACFFLFFLYATPSFATPLFFKQRDLLGFSKMFIGILTTTASISGIISTFFYNKFIDKIDLKKCLVIFLGINCLLDISYLFYNNIIISILITIVSGFFLMLYHLTILKYIATIVPKGLEGFGFSFICSILNLGSAISLLFGGFLSNYISLNNLILLTLLWDFICFIFILRKKDV